MSKIEVSPIRHNNDDVTVPASARVSFGIDSLKEGMSERNVRLVRYLARHSHWSTFAHAHLLLKRRMPLDLYARYMTYAGAGHSCEIVEIAPGGGGAVDFWERATLWFHLRNLGWASPDLAVLIKSVFPASWAAAADAGLCDPPPKAGDKMIVCAICPSPGAEMYHLRRHTEMDRRQIERLVSCTVLVKTPFAIARQLTKHVSDLVFTPEDIVQNEVSRRYVDATPPMFEVEAWRERPEGGIKQGSGEGRVESISGPGGTSIDVAAYVKGLYEGAVDGYEDLLGGGIAPEQARFVLPQGAMTSYWLTGTVDAFRRICDLRLDGHAQGEIRDLAGGLRAAIGDLLEDGDWYERGAADDHR